MIGEWVRWGVMVFLSILGAAGSSYLSAQRGTKKALEDHEKRIVRLETLSEEKNGGYASRTRVETLEERVDRVEDFVFQKG